MTLAERGAALKLVPEEPGERMNKSMNSWETITLIAIKKSILYHLSSPNAGRIHCLVSSFQTIFTTKTRTKLLYDLLCIWHHPTLLFLSRANEWTQERSDLVDVSDGIPSSPVDD